MIALLLALQDTVVEALPEDAASAAAQASAEVVHGSINYFDLMLKASLPVKLIVLPESDTVRSAPYAAKPPPELVIWKSPEPVP